MTRSLYRFLLRLHPSDFRDKYSDEMLCVFDELAAERSGRFLLADGARSLGRQWFLGVGLWKAAIALVLALLPIMVVLQGVGRNQRRFLDRQQTRISAPSFPIASSQAEPDHGGPASAVGEPAPGADARHAAAEGGLDARRQDGARIREERPQGARR
jgi:hypothetical protein